MKAIFFTIFTLMVALAVKIHDDDQDESDYICDGNHDNEMQYNDIMEYSEDLKDDAIDEKQKEITESKKVVKANVLVSNNQEVKQQNATKKVTVNNKTSSSKNETKANKTPDANQNIGVKEDIRHNESLPLASNATATKNVTQTKNATVAQKNKTNQKQRLGKTIQLQKFDISTVQTRQKPKTSLPQTQQQKNVTTNATAVVQNTTQQVQKNKTAESNQTKSNATANETQNATKVANTTAQNVTNSLAQSNETAAANQTETQNQTAALNETMNQTAEVQNQTAPAVATTAAVNVTKLTQEVIQKEKKLTKTEKLADKILDSQFGAANALKIAEIVPEEEQQPEPTDDDIIKASYPKNKKGSVSGAIQELVARQSKVETKAEQMVAEDEYSVPDSGAMADRAMEDIQDMTRKQVNYQLRKHMKDGVFDQAEHEDETPEQPASFSQNIAPSVMPEVKIPSPGGMLDLVQDPGFQDQLLGSAAQEENSLLRSVHLMTQSKVSVK